MPFDPGGLFPKKTLEGRCRRFPELLNIELKKMGWLQLESHYAEVSKGVAGAAFARRQAWNAPVANEFVVRHPLEAAATLSRVFCTLGPAIPRR
jgi:hypothetical protein